MRFILLISFALLAACANSNDLDEPTADLGNFLLGHNVVVATKAEKGPLSRDASAEELQAALKSAIDERFSRYDGDHYYHLGVSVEGYNIALPGVPIVASPKSVLLLNLTVWDDAQNKKLLEKPAQLTVFESLNADTIIGSGLTKTKAEQLEILSRNAAKQIESYLLTRRDWFGEAPAPTSITPPASAAVKPAPVSTARTSGASAVFAPQPEPAILPPS
ncbi:hypothetical protein [Pseudooceanicola sp.]|uniref:hypothetical protein n=1 Tax=Pseudooceanicola sp. TaxID=1914328 RepID=UPI002612DD5A|nr:hypothetical protein [Pseudooceanicola sp.]MDF1857059.1 hypothetical protein [Pseudooceanicola sp.]